MGKRIVREGSFEYKQLTAFEDKVYSLAASMHFRQAHLINCLFHMIEELVTHNLERYPNEESNVLGILERQFQEMIQRVRADSANVSSLHTV